MHPDNMTDAELIRQYQFSNDPLVRLLIERLEMRARDIQDQNETLTGLLLQRPEP